MSAKQKLAGYLLYCSLAGGLTLEFVCVYLIFEPMHLCEIGFRRIMNTMYGVMLGLN